MPSRGICAHRGASDTHPENTLAAFREAIRLGAHMIEFDVALTKDGQLVLMHDSTLDRTTDGSGPVSEWTLAELKKLDAGAWKDSRFKGERIPSLDEALAIMPENIWLNVHLKGGAKLAQEVTKRIVAAKRLQQSFLACGQAAAAAAQQIDSRIQICNMERQANSQRYVDETIAMRTEFIQLYGGNRVDPTHTKQLRQAGVRINYCCANDGEVVDALFTAGVEFPLVDRLEPMLKRADQHGIARLKPVYRPRPNRDGQSTPRSTSINPTPLNKRTANLGSARTESTAASTTPAEKLPAEKLPAGWRVAKGSWHFADGALFVDSMHGEARVTFGEDSWQNYEVEVAATFLNVQNNSRWLAVVIRAASDGSTPWSQFPIRMKTTARNGSEFAVRQDNRWDVRQRTGAAEDSQIGRPRRLRVVVQGSIVKGYLDGELLIESPYCLDRDTGCVGLSVSGCRARFDDFKVRHLPDTPRAHQEPPQPCEVVAHRGYSAVAPENTLVAIRKAIEAGATGCEFDVYAAQDGPIVLMHDTTVDRTTNGSGKVTELTVAELRRLDAGSWKDPRYAGERVPTLEEALRTLKDSGCQAVIEIKMEGISRRVVETVRDAGMLDQSVVIAFSPTVVKEIRALEPRLPCAWLSGEKLKGSPAQIADWIATRARQCNTNLVDLNYNMLSADVLAELKKRGLIVWTWTVNEPVIMDGLMRWGIHSITTDRPDLASQMSQRASDRKNASSAIQD